MNKIIMTKNGEETIFEDVSNRTYESVSTHLQRYCETEKLKKEEETEEDKQEEE